MPMITRALVTLSCCDTSKMVKQVQASLSIPLTKKSYRYKIQNFICNNVQAICLLAHAVISQNVYKKGIEKSMDVTKETKKRQTNEEYRCLEVYQKTYSWCGCLFKAVILLFLETLQLFVVNVVLGKKDLKKSRGCSTSGNTSRPVCEFCQ